MSIMRLKRITQPLADSHTADGVRYYFFTYYCRLLGIHDSISPAKDIGSATAGLWIVLKWCLLVYLLRSSRMPIT